MCHRVSILSLGVRPRTSEAVIDAQIAEQDPLILSHQHIFRLDIAMNESLVEGCSVLEGFCNGNTVFGEQPLPPWHQGPTTPHVPGQMIPFFLEEHQRNRVKDMVA
jgi:hypothetical protein